MSVLNPCPNIPATDMNDTPRTADAHDFPGRQAAVRLGAALLVALFLILVLVWRDNGQRATLETTAQLTAVGDTHYFPMPAAPLVAPYPPVVSLHGTPFYPADYRHHEFRPDDMIRVGEDEKAGYILYRAPVRPQDAGEHEPGSTYFLKISPTEYLKIHSLK